MVGAERPGRRRRRGPRSVASLLNRCHKCVGEKNERPPRDGGLCQSKPEPSLDLEFRILHVNLRGFIPHRTELEARLSRLGSPEIVGITETLLDAPVLEISMIGYTKISRLDRRNERKGGGISLFAASSIAGMIVHIGDSSEHERSWHILHTVMLGLFCWDCGTALLLTKKILQLQTWKQSGASTQQKRLALWFLEI